MSLIRFVDGIVPLAFLLASLVVITIAVIHDHFLGVLFGLVWIFCFIWTMIREKPIADESTHKYDWELIDEQRRR